MSQPHLHASPEAIYPFDARGVAKRFRHAAIFGALDTLQPGETMRFANDVMAIASAWPTSSVNPAP